MTSNILDVEAHKIYQVLHTRAKLEEEFLEIPDDLHLRSTVASPNYRRRASILTELGTISEILARHGVLDETGNSVPNCQQYKYAKQYSKVWQ